MIAFAALIPLAILGAIIAGIAALAKRNDDEPADGLTRRIVVSALTFGMTVVTAIGVFLLIEITLGSGDEFARSGSSDVAQALAMTIVGAPAAFFLWRYQWKALAGSDGHSIVWLLHQSIASATFSIGTVVALGNGLRFDDFDSGTRSSLAFGIAWLVAWGFHEWIGHRRPSPLLPGLPRAIAAGVGLITLAFGAISLIDALVTQVVDSDVLASSGRFDPIISATLWTAIGALVWAWQFLGQGETDRLSRAGLILGLGVGGGALLGLGGLTALVAMLLNAISDDFDRDGLGASLGAVAVGFLVWRFHTGLATDDRGQRISRHLVSGLSLIGMAVGIGVLVNAGLAALTPAFASSNEIELLWGGLAALVVNAPVWWMTWRPDRAVDPDTGTTTQRTYLTVLGGAAGVSGAIALIYLVFQLLEGLLEGDSLSAIIDGVRAPLGFVVATGAVTAYHYRRWAASRSDAETDEPITVERITFVGDEQVADMLRSDLAVRTTRWTSAGEGRVLSSHELTSHLRALDATDVLIVEEERGYRVIRLLRNGQRPQTGEPQE